ncbi:MAG: TonB-dependent receptor plug domain-containing protein [Gammaproteobacteria bacterium]|nr:TonB-dependent receptor plug domain-containing protein [Gammaproteobacteria bacterium]
MNDSTAIRNTLAAAIAAILGAGPALAQTQGDVTEEVIVTARKVEERLQDVPLAISVFTAASLQETGARDLFDLTRMTPGFSFEKVNRYGVQGGVSRPVIRGMSNILGEGNASVFVDGILYSDSILSFPMDIVERVEVIKGPQAALFGRSTFAGAINFITKKGTNTPENKISLRAAEHSDYEGNFLSRGALVQDKLYYMVHGRYYTFDGMYRNSLDGRRVGDEESKNFNASLEYNPGGMFSAIVSAGITRDDDGHAAIALQERFANNCFLNVARQYYCGEVIEQDGAQLDIAGLQGTDGIDRDSTRISAQLEWDFGAFKIVSSSGLFDTEQRYGYDSTYQGGTAIAPPQCRARRATTARPPIRCAPVASCAWRSPIARSGRRSCASSPRTMRACAGSAACTTTRTAATCAKSISSPPHRRSSAAKARWRTWRRSARSGSTSPTDGTSRPSCALRATRWATSTRCALRP